MASITWPAAFLLAVLVGCTTLLSLKGLIPVHAFFTVAGLLLGYLIPKSRNSFGLKREREDSESSRDAFPRDEVPTRKTLPEIPAAKKDE